MYYLSMDGGGTKLVGLLFDDAYRLISSARVEGTHLAVYPMEKVCEHIADCYRILFADLPRPVHVEILYNICGLNELYAQMLPDGVTVGEICYLSESVSGLYAGTCRHSGFVALSGTGSDAFCVQNDKQTDVIGGWGAILGDEGSGVWMAQQAMQAAIRSEHGWGPHTIFGRILKEHFGFADLREYVAYLYDTPAPFRRLGELLPLVAEAANVGDPLMLDVFCRGGRMMADQMLTLLRRHTDMKHHITACGGAWKAHPAMAEAFTAAITAEFPDAEFILPRFEHVIAGPLCHAIKTGKDTDAVMELLACNFPHFIWNCKP